MENQPPKNLTLFIPHHTLKPYMSMERFYSHNLTTVAMALLRSFPCGHTCRSVVQMEALLRERKYNSERRMMLHMCVSV